MAVATEKSNSIVVALKSSDVQFALVLLSIIFMMFVPLHPVILDVLLAVSITIGFLSLLVAIYIEEPLQFSTFPTFLLLSTLFRLALNVATTRNILLNGAKGHVSKVVTAFGDFVVGGNYFVGFVIFLILVIINFVVITKGAGRVAEVGARFTLDAMPGKQMAIDADLNAGIIDREEAKRKRKKIEEEADFYGSMDGASKFVRGDAIAGIIITGINIIVGLAIGVLQNGLSFSKSAQLYTLLTVGDGLVSQIPSIIVSVAAGIVVTRASQDNKLSYEIGTQMFLHPRAMYICAAMLCLLALVPGLPKLSFFLLALAFGLIGSYATKEIERRTWQKTLANQEDKKETNRKEQTVESLLNVDILALEVGVGLIPLVDTEQDGEILERIVSARKQFAQDLGIIVPMVMVRDNIQLKAGDYQILLKGNKIANGTLIVDHELAMVPSDIIDPIDGIPTKEPAYGLDAVWIEPQARDEAAFRGYTVVNCATVVVTHLTKVIQDYCYDLIGRQEVQGLIDSLKEKYPKVVEEVLGNEALNLGIVVRVLQNLLTEGVSIRDMLTIFETLADCAKTTKHPDILTRYVRIALGRGIVRKYLNMNDVLYISILDRALEDLVIASLEQQDNGLNQLNLDPKIAEQLLTKIANSVVAFNEKGVMPLLLCGAQIRWDLKKLIDRFIPQITVLAYDEVPADITTQTLAVIDLTRDSK